MANTSDKLKKVHAQAIDRFNSIWSAVHEERELAVSDRRFYMIAGAQWEGAIGEQFAEKSRIEVNKVHLSIIRIINEYRNNRITVDFTSKDGKDGDGLADVCDGLYRSDEQNSDADDAYDLAFEEGASGGYGAWRYTTKFEDPDDDENEHQRIMIEPITDADQSVFFDLAAKRQDKADAKFCFVVQTMTPDDYKEEYNDDPSDWPVDKETVAFDWATPDVVYVAEYYVIEKAKHTVHIYRLVDGSEVKHSEAELDRDPGILEELLGTGAVKVREKSVKKQQVRKYILSGSHVLEDAGVLAGSHIPIVPFYGKRSYVDNLERCSGHVRIARDAQRLLNMQVSKLADMAAQSALQKPILTPEQIAGHETVWAEDNIKNYPYLLINQMTDGNGNVMPSGPVAYTKPPDIPPTLGVLLQSTNADIQELLGSQQAGEELQPNVSGKAVELVQQRIDMQTAIYVNNFGKSVKRGGQIWLSMARDIYVETDRRMKTVGSQKETGSVTLGDKIITDDGEVLSEGDLSRANFNVNVDVGPSTSSKKASTVRSLMGMMQITPDPETQQVLGSMAMMNMEGEGIGDIREYFRKKLVSLGVSDPTEEDLKEARENQEQQPPDMNAAFLEAEATKAQALAQKAQADTGKAVADTEKSKAQTVEILSGIDRDDRQQAINLATELDRDVQRPPVQPNVTRTNGPPPGLEGV